MSKSYKRGRDKKTGQFITLKAAEKHPSKAIVETTKIKPPAKRTIKAAPKSGKISSSSIKKAVEFVSSSRKKK